MPEIPFISSLTLYSLKVCQDFEPHPVPPANKHTNYHMSVVGVDQRFRVSSLTKVPSALCNCMAICHRVMRLPSTISCHKLANGLVKAERLLIVDVYANQPSQMSVPICLYKSACSLESDYFFRRLFLTSFIGSLRLIFIR